MDYQKKILEKEIRMDIYKDLAQRNELTPHIISQPLEIPKKQYFKPRTYE